MLLFSSPFRLLRGVTLRLPPSGVLVVTYLVLIVIGGLLLGLPVATHGTISWSDALFTATSAVTVTGLVVVDTGGQFTLFGQIVIALLIQLGGLGIVTVGVLTLSILGLPIGLVHRRFLRSELNQTSMGDLLHLSLVILRVVLICELAGVVLLATVFVPEFGWGHGLWQAVFHAVSAFNNAGFGLFPDSLSRWVTDPVVNITIMTLFVIGGLGFVVLADVIEFRSWNRCSIHTKLMLAGTAIIGLISVVLFALIEWNNPGTLGQIETAGGKLIASLFQALTPRTAGFNTLDTAMTEDATTLLTMVLMFIGGGSASTAGGIKVTTFVLLLLGAAAFLKQHASPHAFGRSLDQTQVMKVVALLASGLTVLFAGALLLIWTQEGEFLDLLFEAVSAFATVGLSRGATGDLNEVGRAVVMALMFLGRVGPLALGIFVATRVPPRIRYPSGQIFLG